MNGLVEGPLLVGGPGPLPPPLNPALETGVVIWFRRYRGDTVFA